MRSEAEFITRCFCKRVGQAVPDCLAVNDRRSNVWLIEWLLSKQKAKREHRNRWLHVEESFCS